MTNKRAGLLFLAKDTNRILLILENRKWTVPTFEKETCINTDSKEIVSLYYGKPAKIIPIELYLSADKGFEYGTYVCVVSEEFLIKCNGSYCWCELHNLPQSLHLGLKTTLSNPVIRSKIDTISQLELMVE